MNKKLLFSCLTVLVVVASVAYARRGRPLIQQTVTPLSGYAGQISSGDTEYMAPSSDLMAPASESLLDEPTQ